MKKVITVLLVLGGLYYGYQLDQSSELSEVVDSRPAAGATTADSSWRSGAQVRSSGTVLRTLADDNDGSRHQRFILKLDSGRTILIAHNIDLAPRIGSISQGDTVSFYGQFETNDRGGVVHWTHKDPQGRHVDGWLEHRGRRYE